MGLAINTNVSALNTYRNLNATQNSMSKSLEKLSSGLRINRAADDAAGLTIATNLGAQVSGLSVAARNAQDGVSVVQTADGALGQAQTILGRLRDLAVQAANDSNSADARTAIKTEATSLVSELDRLGQSVNFNGTNLLDGSAGTLNFQVGADGNAQSQISVSTNSANLRSVATALSTGALSSGRSWTGFDLGDVPTSLTFTSTSGATTTDVAVSGLTAPTSFQNLADQLNANAAFQGKFTASVTKATDGTPTGIQVAANDGSAVTMLAADQTSLFTTSGATAAGTATAGIQFNNAANAQLAIAAIDTQIKNVSTARASLGALQNRFESAVASINVSIENLTASKSRITDVDMAQEMVNYTRSQVLSQSGVAMLAQANSAPQLALKLLG
jgi:flagellin